MTDVPVKGQKPGEDLLHITSNGTKLAEDDNVPDAESSGKGS